MENFHKIIYHPYATFLSHSLGIVWGEPVFTMLLNHYYGQKENFETTY